MERDKWGRRIRAFRKLKGYTQEELAKHIGVSVSVLGEIERGNRMPAEHILDKISNSLDITMKELTPKEVEK
ncbi:helix-turn-helix transcriptional regulator [Bacillus sp. FJAT-50079]|uniref:helix-turn-helix domain-containing protein n=1 Tax=Bacillus sp. FJAT-50079 TaxID=2833577 RepID=UPI001BCA1A1D|nr:helix-turn-helix transcriptional regulator [Bacillus sp. FJAT-50079]MBS4210827.1 helix-turn-helix transcriptional regulator [Bacillus sp. FJAT-50079]